jgi:hypothetical protein
LSLTWGFETISNKINIQNIFGVNVYQVGPDVQITLLGSHFTENSFRQYLNRISKHALAVAGDDRQINDRVDGFIFLGRHFNGIKSRDKPFHIRENLDLFGRLAADEDFGAAPQIPTPDQ